MIFQKKLVLIGAGNVATHLAMGLKRKGFKIIQVYSRTKRSAEMLAGKVNAFPITRIQSISTNADLYIIAVPDSVLPDIASKLKLKNLVVHTSGFQHLNILRNSSERTGVFYPLQTFSKNRKADFSHVPLCIEANNKKDERMLKDLANTLSSDVRLIDSETRRMIHMAAVFACNFTNYMYFAAEEILKKSKISFDIIKPLIIETAQKVMNEKPAEAQTGPARRGDNAVIKKHLEMISDRDMKKIYKLVSEQI